MSAYVRGTMPITETLSATTATWSESPYLVTVCGPMHALLIAAERLVVAGIAFDDIKHALADYMEFEAQRQEEPRDAEV